MKVTGKLSEIPNKVKTKEEQFKEALLFQPHVFDEEYAMKVGIRYFDLSANRSLQIFKETLPKKS